MYEIKVKQIMQEMKVDDEVILKYRIEYPEMQSSRYYYGKELFNIYNKKIAKEAEAYCKTELFRQAKETYAYNKENNYPVMVYEFIQQYSITYNTELTTSLYIDKYEFTGGAHGNTIRTAQNWDLRIAKQIPLSNLFPDNPNYILDILNQINMQIQEQIVNEEEQYMDGYCQLVIQNFKTDNFVIYPNYLEVFFQQYDIAPYVTGIPTFQIERKI